MDQLIFWFRYRFLIPFFFLFTSTSYNNIFGTTKAKQNIVTKKAILPTATSDSKYSSKRFADASLTFRIDLMKDKQIPNTSLS